MAKLTPVNTPFFRNQWSSLNHLLGTQPPQTQTVLYLFKQSQMSQNHFFSRFERMKIFNLIGLLMQVGADECYFQFKNSSPDSVRIALRPQLHVRITTKKEFAVTPRSHHLGTFRLQVPRTAHLVDWPNGPKIFKMLLVRSRSKISKFVSERFWSVDLWVEHR